MTFAVYANSLGNTFVSDDKQQLISNPLVKDYHHLGEVFSHDVWIFLDPNARAVSNYYRPIQIVVYVAMYRLFRFNPLSFHLLTVLLHVGNTLLVFQLSESLLRHLPRPRLAALIAAALFAVHPIHDEAVVWVAVMPDLVMTLLALGLLALFIRQEAAPRGKQIVLYAAAFLVAMLTKETSAAILPLLVSFEWLYLRRTWREVLKNIQLYASLLVTFAVYLAMRLHALGSLAPAQGGHFSLHGKELALSIVVLMGTYWWKLLVPAGLSYYHSFSPAIAVTPLAILCVAVVGSLVAAVFLLRQKAPLISFGLAFIFLPLLPVMNVNGVGPNVFAERYLYLPSVGFVWIAALAWDFLRRRSATLAWSCLSIILTLSVYTLVKRTAEWHDDITLYLATKDLNPNKAGIHRIQGVIWEANGRLDEAIAETRTAVQLDPTAPGSYLNLGKMLAAKGLIQDAIEAQERAVQLKPDFYASLNELGLLKLKTKDYATAASCFQRAVRLNPRFATAQMNLGIAYNALKDYPHAAEALRKGLEKASHEPFLFLAHYHLGIALSHLDSNDEAAREFAKALELQPDFTPAKQALDSLRATPR